MTIECKYCGSDDLDCYADSGYLYGDPKPEYHCNDCGEVTEDPDA